MKSPTHGGDSSRLPNPSSQKRAAGMACAAGPDPPSASAEDERPQWDNKLQYLLSCVGFAVGLGNLWRFPYLCQTHGGGAFLIPYVIALVFEGIPLFHVELAIGQRLRRGSIGVWRAISPYLGGVGLVQECQDTSPVTYFWYRQTLNITPDINDSGAVQGRLLLCMAASWAVVYLCVIRGIETAGKAIYFTALFPYVVLSVFLVRGLTLPGATEGLLHLFTPDMQVLRNPRVWLDAATQIFFSLSLAFGGHIAFASYNPPRNHCERDAVTIALVNSMTSLYASIAVFSVLGFKAANDHGRCLDGNILLLLNAFDLPDQSVSRDDYAAVLSHLNATQPERVARLPLQVCHLEDFLDKSASGTGLAFIVFAEAVLHMPGAPVWAVLFFGMLFSLGLSSMFGNMESILTPLFDQWVRPRRVPKEVLTGLVCLACFLLASGFTLQSGNYWLEIFDQHAASLNLIFLAFFEVVGVIYVYGMKRFCDDVAWMTGRRPGLYWQVTWKVVSPLLLLTILVAYLALLASRPPSYRAWNPQHEAFPSREEKPYQGWVQVACVLLSFLPSLWVPGVALAQLLAQRRQKQPSAPQDRRPELQGGGVC
uniref:Transporter n=1 Tax=Sus scrofa TaxID=9823 RepID=A0A4X1THB2_PIG